MDRQRKRRRPSREAERYGATDRRPGRSPERRRSPQTRRPTYASVVRGNSDRGRYSADRSSSADLRGRRPRAYRGSPQRETEYRPTPPRRENNYRQIPTQRETVFRRSPPRRAIYRYPGSPRRAIYNNRGYSRRNTSNTGYRPAVNATRYYDNGPRAGPPRNQYRPYEDRYSPYRDRAFRPYRQRSRQATPFNRRELRETRPQNIITSDDPDFVAKVKIIHRIIKAEHHLNNVAGEEPPPIIRRTTENLANFIKPAAPNRNTQTLLQGNAKNWEHTALMILRQHYEESMNEDIHKLALFPRPDWQGPLQIATTWAKRNLGRRLKVETLQKTERFLKDNLTAETEADMEGGSQTHSSAAPSPESDRPVTTQTQTGPYGDNTNQSLLSSSPLSPHSPAPVPPPPPLSPAITIIRAKGVSIATMTEDMGGPESPAHRPEDEGNNLPAASFPPAPPSSPWARVSDSPPASSPRPTEERESALDPRPQRRPRTATAGTTTTAGTRASHPGLIYNPCVDHGETVIDSPESTFPIQREPDRATATESSDNQPLTRAQESRSIFHPSVYTPRLRPIKTDTTRVPLQHTFTPTGTLGQRLTLQGTVTPTRRPTRHLNTGNKLRDWSLCIREKNLIIGDSNVARFPPFQVKDLQVDSYPGATLRHAEFLLRKATGTTEPQRVILSFGLNNRNQKARSTAIKQLQGLLRVAKSRFPSARILVPVINHSATLPYKEQLNLQVLNTHIQKHCDAIQPLSNKDFNTERDGVHWTHSTAAHIFSHWSKQLN